MLKRVSQRGRRAEKPEAYPWGYVEDFFEPRTKRGKERVLACLGLGGCNVTCFSIRYWLRKWMRTVSSPSIASSPRICGMNFHLFSAANPATVNSLCLLGSKITTVILASLLTRNLAFIQSSKSFPSNDGGTFGHGVYVGTGPCC